MDSAGLISVHSRSEQIQPQQQRDNSYQSSSPLQNQDTNATTKDGISSLADQPASSSTVAINSTKAIPLVMPQFTIPPLPNTQPRRRSESPDNRITPNPAHQVFSYPVSSPQHATPENQKSLQEDGPPPAQRRKLNSPEKQDRSLKSDEEPDSRRGSAGKGAMSYDPVHDYHQQPIQHHSRRPSSANSQRSHMSSYSAHSSNPEGEELSPPGGDQPVSKDGKKRKHKCQECGQYFTRLHNLKSHLLTHSQEKPFICQDCGHKFRRLHDLKRHHKLHTGERPYTCSGCNRSFARMDALNRHRKPGGECALHNMSTSSAQSQQNAVDRRLSLPPGFGRPTSSQGSTSPMPQPAYTLSDVNINPALAAASHGHSYPPTHLPPKQKHRYPRDPDDPSPGLLAPPSASTAYGRSPPPPAFGPTGNGRGVQPPPLVIPNSTTAGPTLSPIHPHHYSAGTQTGSSSSGGRSAPGESRSLRESLRDDQAGPAYSLTESPRGMTPPPFQVPPALSVTASSLPLLPSPGTLISPSTRNSYDHSTRQSMEGGRSSDGSRGYLDALLERNRELEDRIKQLESFVNVLWQEREHSLRRQSTESLRPPS